MMCRFHVWMILAVLLATEPGCLRREEPVFSDSAQQTRHDPPPAVTAGAGLQFDDTTQQSGVVFRQRSGAEAGHRSILESIGGGVALLDFDGDGQLDLFFPGGGTFDGEQVEGRPSGLFRQERSLRFRDVSGTAGDDFPSLTYTHGCAAADFDSDGFPDILVTGYGGVQFWRNLGDGTFQEEHLQAGLNDPRWSTSAGWGDVDGDGDLDLYVVHYVNWSFENHPRCRAPGAEVDDVCPPQEFAPLADTLWMSNGEGTFRPAAFDTGLRSDGKGLGVALADLDGDGHLDIYVANDSTDNFFYRNDGFGGFGERGMEAGLAVTGRGLPAGSSGVDVGDFDDDGRLDLWVTNAEGEPFSLYRNDAPGQFLDISHVTGMAQWEGDFVGFGTKFVDLNRDGFLDVVFANGHVRYHPTQTEAAQVPMVLLNQQGRDFLSWKPPEGSYFSRRHVGRGLAIGDLDNDGAPDLVFTHRDSSPVLLHNASDLTGGWLMVRLIGRQSPRDGQGAWVKLETDQTSQLRIVAGGTSYLSHSDLRPHFGFPAHDRPVRLMVRWPSGQEQVVLFPAANTTLTLVEP